MGREFGKGTLLIWRGEKQGLGNLVGGLMVGENFNLLIFDLKN